MCLQELGVPLLVFIQPVYSDIVIKTRADISVFPHTGLKSAFLAVKDPALQN